MAIQLYDIKKIEHAKKKIKDIYLSDTRPWVVGFSGGKDSTAVVQLIFEALNELPRRQRKKKVFVLSSDTFVETPLIISYIDDTLSAIQQAAIELGLPIETHKVFPRTKDTFWCLLIGKGYPSPRQKFRWCTDRLKILPANRFVLDKVSKYGEVVMVLGVRTSESVTRLQVIRSHSVEGKELMKHSTLTNAFVFAPISDFSVDDVWGYLLDEKHPSPWGNDNYKLFDLYADSNAECPLMIDKEIKESAGSCGNSRFGCWVCTVVKEDKALQGFIESGHTWLIPLLRFRNWLMEIRDNRDLRQKCRNGGQVYFLPFNDDSQGWNIIPEENLGEYLKNNNVDLTRAEDLNLLVKGNDGQLKKLGLGPFTLEARQMILRELLRTEREVINNKPNDIPLELIRMEELKVIRRFWLNDGDWDDSLPTIYREETGKNYDWEIDDRPFLCGDDLVDLELLCQQNGVSLHLIKDLIKIEKRYGGYKVRQGIFKEIGRALNQDWLHL
ncbi:MAG: DNA phosphorothioation system sulfurtransferase DndC [Bacillota bacterium]